LCRPGHGAQATLQWRPAAYNDAPEHPVNTTSNAPEVVKPTNFLRQIIEADLEKGTYAQRHWGGTPGDAQHHQQGQVDEAKIRTRFPPEPNGYLWATPSPSA
jgi:hypothetical protein